MAGVYRRCRSKLSERNEMISDVAAVGTDGGEDVDGGEVACLG